MDTKTNHVSAVDVAILQRVAKNLEDYASHNMPIAQAAGVFSVNAEELLEVIERITRPANPLQGLIDAFDAEKARIEASHE